MIATLRRLVFGSKDKGAPAGKKGAEYSGRGCVPSFPGQPTQRGQIY
jgi:hypothetical protein